MRIDRAALDSPFSSDIYICRPTDFTTVGFGTVKAELRNAVLQLVFQYSFTVGCSEARINAAAWLV